MIEWGCQVRKMLVQSFQQVARLPMLDYPPMTHENRLCPGLLRISLPTFQGDVLLEVHRFWRGLHSEMVNRSSAGRRRQCGCAVT